MRLTEAFEQFHDNIALSSLSEERINRAWGRLHHHLTQAYSLTASFVYIQGSYANDTAVKPADNDGEYDLDIVCLCADVDADAEETINDLTAVLSRDADLESRIEPNESGRPCVRLRYADDPDGFGFHVDVVPARGEDPAAVIEVPIRGFEDWRESAPYLYTQWCRSQPERFSRLIRFLKRWRDEHGDGSIASITLQVLSASYLVTEAASDAEAVTATLEAIAAFLDSSPDSPPEISNPVLESENLADRWEDADYRKFRRELAEAVDLSRRALQSPDEAESHAIWGELFGSDFPGSPEEVEHRGSEEPPPPPPPPDAPDSRQQAPADERYG
jgi:Second Messenger Oligonucleotide or Dinucleotide Synthetase domain